VLIKIHSYGKKIRSIFFIFFYFLFFNFLAGPSSAHVAGLDPAGLAGSQAWPGWPFFCFLPAGVREPFTHACYSNMQLKCREGQHNLPVAALEDGDDNWPTLLLSVTAFCLLLYFSFPCSVVFFFFFSVCSPARPCPSVFVLLVHRFCPLFFFFFLCFSSVFLPSLWPSLAYKARGWLFSSRVRASRSWGTNASVSLRRNRGRKLAPLCIVSVLASWCVRGEGGATVVAASTGLEEGDDEGAVAGQNLLSPLYNLPLFVRCFSSLISSVSLRRNRGTKVCLFSPLSPLCYALFSPPFHDSFFISLPPGFFVSLSFLFEKTSGYHTSTPFPFLFSSALQPFFSGFILP